MKPRRKPVNVLSFARLAGIASLFGPTKPVAKKESAQGRTATTNLKSPVSARVRTVDDDSVEEMRGDGPDAAARRRERERCQAIVGSPVGLRHPALAANLAFGTRLRRSEALVLLDACDRPSHDIDRIAINLKTWSATHVR